MSDDNLASRLAKEAKAGGREADARFYEFAAEPLTIDKQRPNRSFHEQMQSDACVCGHTKSEHLYGDYYDEHDVKRKHQGECGQCGCQGYG